MCDFCCSTFVTCHIQWCRKVKNFRGASGNGGHNLPTPGWNRINCSAKYWEGGSVAPPASPVPAPLNYLQSRVVLWFFGLFIFVLCDMCVAFHQVWNKPGNKKLNFQFTLTQQMTTNNNKKKITSIWGGSICSCAHPKKWWCSTVVHMSPKFRTFGGSVFLKTSNWLGTS